MLRTPRPGRPACTSRPSATLGDRVRPMRAPVATTLALLMTVLVPFAACGGAKKDADNPENASGSSSDDEGGAAAVADSSEPVASAAPAGSGAPGDDGSKKAGPCGGFDIPDL